MTASVIQLVGDLVRRGGVTYSIICEENFKKKKEMAKEKTVFGKGLTASDFQLINTLINVHSFME